MAAKVNSTHKLSFAMHTTEHWFFSEDIPSDILVQVGESKFPLHKIMLIAKSNYIRRLIVESKEQELEIDLSNIPGGAEMFEKVARFCYGVKVEMTVNNAAALHCAAVFLEMTAQCCEHNLADLTHGFLTQVALSSLTGAITVIKSCQHLLPLAQEINIVNQCAQVISNKACDEADSPSRSPANWWAEELTNLNITFFHKIINSMKSHRMKPLAIACAITTFAKRSLPDLVFNHSIADAKSPITDESRHKQRAILDSIVDLLPLETQQPIFSIKFLCYLLRFANFLQSNGKKLEKLISAVLEHVTVDDLLILSSRFDGKRLRDLESVRRIVKGFVEKEKSNQAPSRAMVSVAKTVDAYLHEIARDGALSISQFNGVASLVPKHVRDVDDDLYRAIDIYLQAHPNLDEIEREKVCNTMDPLKLSVEARVHASKNKRLPLQIVLHTLYFDQLQERSGQSTPMSAQSMRLQVNTDVKLAKENERLRHELLWMKMYVSDMEKSCKVASKMKKPTFFSSVSKTLGKLNPFKQGSKDTTNIDDHMDRMKPRRRRFSMS
ncbi:root phototropism protein 2-like [Bidens hawaiensis]|uniref:root phototropism protein 2-like n=1 Tax=Bidens hawaiensis TaxID=980011 RepID=UPI004048EC1D